MANSDPATLLGDIERELGALEAECAQAERIITSGAFEDFDRSVWNQRRLTHALQNAMAAAATVRTPEFDESVRNRLRFIGLTRDRHIAMLAKYRDEAGQRLNVLTRWKRAARKWLTGYSSPRGTGGIDQMR